MNIPSTWIGGTLIVISIVVIVTMLWRNRKVLATECGHRTKVRGVVMMLGKEVAFKLPLKHGETAHCSDCLAKMAIRCAWCGEPILIGHPITLYSAMNGDWVAPDYAVPYSEGEDDRSGRYLGCLRWKCAEMGGDRAGFWLPPGRVHRVPTAVEMMMADLARGGDGVVVIPDLFKP